MTKTNKRPPAYSLRLVADVREWVVEKAKESDRSLNAEINRILRKQKEEEE